MLTPIPRTTPAAACTKQLREHILKGTWPPGSRLPPERALAAELGINRVTLRAALAALAAEKLVTIRQGSGITVADFLETAGPGLITSWLELARGERAADAIADLLAVRRALARVVLERVARNIDAAGRGRLASAVQSFARVLYETRDPRAIAAADLDVMRALVAETRSPVLQLCANPVATILASLPHLQDAMFAHPERSLLGYQQLLDALAAGVDGAAVGAVLTDLLESHDRATLDELRRRRR